MRPHRSAIVVALAAAVLATTARADVTFSLVGDRTSLETGDTLTVSVDVSVAGDAFNGYDAIFSYDPTFLELLPPVPASAGEGALFTEACGLRFLNVSDDGDSTRYRVSHVILCAGVSVTGPGRLYTLAFRAREASGATIVSLTGETQTYDAGELVTTVVEAPLIVPVNAVTSAPAAGRGLDLRAAPNPFNPATTLHFDLPEAGSARLEIFDARGRHVLTLLDRALPAGPFAARWNGRDTRGDGAASGLYFARLRTARDEAVTRLVLVR